MKQQHDEEPTLASLAGASFALLQHGLDRATEWGFSKLKQVPPPAPQAASTTSNKFLRLGGNFMRSTARFFGTAGDSYYRTYKDLKKGS